MNSASNQGGTAALTTTPWLLVIIAAVAGFATAFNVGKVSPTLPLIQDELGLSLAQSGWVVSSFSILAMLFSFPMAIICMRLGAYRVGVTALTLLGLGALGSSHADSFQVLLACRVIESVGFVMVAVAAPALITSVTQPKDRPIAMAIWSTWMPVGVSIMMLVSPTLIHWQSWRSVWLFVALFVLLWLFVVAISYLPHRNRLPPQQKDLGKLVRPLFNPASFILAVSFSCFACIFLVIISFMPTYWLDTSGIPTTTSAYWMIGIIMCHVIGNLASGWLVSRAIPTNQLLFWSFVPATLLAGCAFLEGMPLWGQIACVVAFMLLAGVVPGTMFAVIPTYVSLPAQVSLMVGFVFQGAATGQVAGPVLFGSLIDWAGGDWRWGTAYFVFFAVAAGMIMWRVPPPKVSVS